MKKNALDRAQRDFVEAIMDALPQMATVVAHSTIARIADAGQRFCMAQDAMRRQKGGK